MPIFRAISVLKYFILIGAGGTTFKIAKWLNLNYLAIFLSLNFCRVPYKVTYYDSI